MYGTRSYGHNKNFFVHYSVFFVYYNAPSMGNKYLTKLFFAFVLFFLNQKSYGSILSGRKDRLECYDCSEISTDPTKVCSKNEGRTEKATNDDHDYQCRIWALNSVSIHKALVHSDLCANATLQSNINSNFNNNFKDLKLREEIQVLFLNFE